MSAINEDLYPWFQAMRQRCGLSQAWELLCAALGVSATVVPYLERFVADEQAAVRQEWATIAAEWERIFTMEDSLKRRGVDHLVWNCPALATRTCRMWQE